MFGRVVLQSIPISMKALQLSPSLVHCHVEFFCFIYIVHVCSIWTSSNSEYYEMSLIEFFFQFFSWHSSDLLINLLFEKGHKTISQIHFTLQSICQNTRSKNSYIWPNVYLIIIIIDFWALPANASDHRCKDSICHHK